MFKIEIKELKMSNEFRKKIEMICKFACVKYELINGNIISIKNTNLAYVRPHILKVKGNDYLLFEDSNIVFINGYKDKIMLIELEKHLLTITMVHSINYIFYLTLQIIENIMLIWVLQWNWGGGLNE